MACVQNPLVGTEFESLEFLEPQLSRAAPPNNRQRLLVLGAGVAGAEAARMAAAFGHTVEIWDAAKTAGGQVPLALAAPDKEDVAGVWTYRVDELERLNVPIRLGMQITADALLRFAPDLVIVATGSRPRQAPMPLDVRVPVLQAWDVLADADAIKPGAKVTLIGGGMVGIETAEVLGGRGCAVTVIEILSTVAREMARNNRFDVLLGSSSTACSFSPRQDRWRGRRRTGAGTKWRTHTPRSRRSHRRCGWSETEPGHYIRARRGGLAERAGRRL